MKKRNLVPMVLLTIVTFGIYGLYWTVKTKGEMNQQGAKIPTAWLIIIPGVSIWWMWKYSEGVAKVTGEKLSTVLSFILLQLLGIVGILVVQYHFNTIDTTATVAGPIADTNPANLTAPAPVAPITPDQQPVATVAPTAPAQQPVATVEPTVSSQQPAAPVTPSEPTDPTQTV